MCEYFSYRNHKSIHCIFIIISSCYNTKGLYFYTVIFYLTTDMTPRNINYIDLNIPLIAQMVGVSPSTPLDQSSFMPLRENV